MAAQATTAAQFHEAVRVLYHSPDDGSKRAASVWLEQWQASPGAWDLAAAVLNDSGGAGGGGGGGGAPVEARYLAAQTLRTKVQRDFEELPPSAVPPLRDALAASLTAGTAPPIVRTQVCLALAALAAHAPAPAWPGGGPVPWLAATLLDGPAPAAAPAALELLAVLAEEAGAYQPSLTPARRRAWAAEAGAAAPAALSILARCVGGADAPVRAGALAAYAAWVRLASSGAVSSSSAAAAAGGGDGGHAPSAPATLSLPGMDGPALASHPLTAAALAGLADPALFDEAVEAVAELVYISAAGGRPAPGMEALAGAIVPGVLALRPRFAAACAAARGARGGGPSPAAAPAAASGYDDDDDTAKGMARLFAEVGEAYVGLIAAAATPDAAAPAAALLDVAAHPDDGVCAISFNFWHRLARALTGGSGGGRGGGAASSSSASRATAGRPATANPAAVAAFTPAFESLVSSVAGRVAWPPGHEAWRRDEVSDFKRGRAAVAGTLLDAAAVLGGRRTLELLTAPLASAAAAVAAGGGLDWRPAEAALYCVRAVHRAAPPPGDALLSGLLASLPTLPPHPALQYTACLTVGAYADWVAASATTAGGGGAAALAPLLGLVTRALACPEAAPAAALALRHLCDAAGGLLGPHLGDLAALAGAAAGAGAARGAGGGRGGGGASADGSWSSGGGGGGGGGGSETGGGAGPPPPTPDAAGGLAASLGEADVVAIAEAAALAAAAQPDPAARRAGLDALLLQCERGLASAVEGCGGGAAGGPRPSTTSGGGPTSSPSSSTSLVCAMADRLAAVLAHCGPDPAAAAASLGRALPVVEAALAATAGDVRAAERLIRVPRYALRATGPATAATAAPGSGPGPALAAVAAALPRWFAGTRCSAALYAASELCKAHGRGAAGPAADALVGLLESMLGPTLAGLGSTAAFDAAPDVADDAFLLAGRALAYCPALLLVAGGGRGGGGGPGGPLLLPALLAAAVPGCLAQHREACASVLAFLARALDADALARADADVAALAASGATLPSAAAAAAARAPPARDALAAAVGPVAPALARALLAGVTGGLPPGRVRDVADVLLSLVRAAGGAGVAWLADAVALLPDDAAAAGDRARLVDAAAAVAAAASAGGAGTGGDDAAGAAFDAAVDDLSELARRSARARNAALAALAPEAAALGGGAARLGTPVLAA